MPALSTGIGNDLVNQVAKVAPVLERLSIKQEQRVKQVNRILSNYTL